jgi:hypothetical protein
MAYTLPFIRPRCELGRRHHRASYGVHLDGFPVVLHLCFPCTVKLLTRGASCYKLR